MRLNLSETREQEALKDARKKGEIEFARTWEARSQGSVENEHSGFIKIDWNTKKINRNIIVGFVDENNLVIAVIKFPF